MKVLFFASLQELMGPERLLEVPPGSTVKDLLDQLEQQEPRLAPMRRYFRVALDLQMAPSEDAPLEGVSEVALIPPVSGGGGPYLRLGAEPIVVDEVLAAVRRPDCGAVVLFLGTVRDCFQGQPVEYIDYQSYPAMALKEMGELAQEAEQRLEDGEVALWHRDGRVAAGDISVAVAVSSRHRKQAFEVGQWLIDTLKARVPLWKKEVGPDGAIWIEGDCRIPV